MGTLTLHPKTARQPRSTTSPTPGPRFGRGGAANSIHHLQRMIGNQALQRLLRSQAVASGGGEAGTDTKIEIQATGPVDQAELPVGVVGALRPGDPRAVSHDFIRPLQSGAVRSSSLHPTITVVTPSASRPVVVQRTCRGGTSSECCGCGDCTKRDADGPAVAAKPAWGGQPSQFAHGSLVPAIVGQVTRSPGAPLPPSLREDCERGFGSDFRDVRIHTDAQAHDAARSIGARAFAVGNRLVFGRDAYAPGTADGRRLIVHELAHVVRQGVTHPPDGPANLRIDDSGEAAADAAADRVIT